MNSLIVALMLTVAVTAQQLTSDNCYYEYLNTKVVCLDAWEVCKNVANCQDCEAICTSFAGVCQAIQYQQSTQECSLYRTAVKPGYGRKKRSPGCYGNAPPSLNRNSPDFTYYIVSNSSSCTGGATAPPVVTYAPATQPPPIVTEPPPPVTQPPPPPQTTQAPLPVTDPPPPPTTMGPGPVVSDSTPALPAQATCPAGQSPILIEIKGNQMAGNPDSQFTATGEQACTQACLANQQPTGVFAPCQSADFNTATMQCNFFINAPPPAGTGQLSTADIYNHYEKTCMDPSVVQSCPGPILKAPQKLLVGYAESIVAATSESDCYVQCLQSEQRFGFKCASGMFYTSETTSNCILNSESASTQPTLFTDETTDKVDYFEPMCTGGGMPASSKKSPSKAQAAAPPPKSQKPTPKPTPKPAPKPGPKPGPKPHRTRRDISSLVPTRKRAVIWPNRPDWGSWTRCDGQLSTRYHYRNCKSMNPNKCEVASEPCDPTNRAKELQDIADEETGGGSVPVSPGPITDAPVTDNGNGMGTVTPPNGNGNGPITTPNGNGMGPVTVSSTSFGMVTVNQISKDEVNRKREHEREREDRNKKDCKGRERDPNCKSAGPPGRH